MAAFNIQEALIWKEKIELVIDQVCFIFKQSFWILHVFPPCRDPVNGLCTFDILSTCSIRNRRLQMVTNMCLLNINLEWITGGMLLLQTMKVSKCLFGIISFSSMTIQICKHEFSFFFFFSY